MLFRSATAIAIAALSLARVASIDVGQQAGGIEFWKITAPR